MYVKRARPWRLRTWLWLLAMAVIWTALNAAKPLHIDDSFYWANAANIARRPLDPYGFVVYWLQWPMPAVEGLSPPVVPYWWALGLRLLPDEPWLWKVWFFPFALLLVVALRALAGRFAPSAETPLVWTIVFSPVVLPGFNLMVDVPCLALGLSAVTLFMWALERGSIGGAVAAGLLAGLAMQTKYTGFAAPGVMLLFALTHAWRRTPLAVLAGAIALAVFVAWEAAVTLRYGTGQFLWQYQHGFIMPWGKSTMAMALVKIAGGTFGVLLLWAVAAARRFASWLAFFAAVVVTAALAGAAVLPYLDTPVVAFGATSDNVFGVVGVLVVAAVAIAMWRLCRLGHAATWRLARWRRDRDEWFLVLWLGLEVASYFLLSPFAAARRVMGVFVVASLLVGRHSALACRDSMRRRLLYCVVAFGTLPALVYDAVDRQEARAFQRGAEQAVERIRAIDSLGTIWFLGHWGFQFHAERAGMKPLVPDYSSLKRGDWVVMPHRMILQVVGFPQGAVAVHDSVTIDDPWRLATVTHYYSGTTPMARLEAPRLTVDLFRIRYDCVPETPWPPDLVAVWADKTRGGTGAAAVPALVRGLRAGDLRTRKLMAYALGQLGPHAQAAIPSLTRALVDRDPEVLKLVGAALERIHRGALINALHHTSARVRKGAATAIGMFGPEATDALAPLRQAANDPDPNVRRAVCAAILAIGGPRQPDQSRESSP